MSTNGSTPRRICRTAQLAALVLGLVMAVLWSAGPASAQTEAAYLPQSGTVVMEAEHAQAVARSGAAWSAAGVPAGSVGGGMKVPDAGLGWGNITTAPTTAPELRFPVNFASAGTYKVWVRSVPASTASDSLHVGLDGVITSTSDHINATTYGSWLWMSYSAGGPGPATVTVSAPGIHSVSIYAREDGVAVDRIMLSLSSTAPSGTGPAESPREGAPLAAPCDPYLPQGGSVTMEAEHGQPVTRSGAPWTSTDAPQGSVDGAMIVPNQGLSWPSAASAPTTAPELRFAVQFASTGTYRIWVRALPTAAANDSLHVGSDGAIPSTSDAITSTDYGSWIWMTASSGGPSPATIQVTSTGTHVISIYANDDGLAVDRIVLSLSTAAPTGSGPAESPRSEQTCEGPYQQEPDGTVVLEAEHPDAVLARTGHSWQVDGPSGSVGGAMTASPDNGQLVEAASAPTQSSELRYLVAFTTTGTYRLAARVQAPDGAANSFHVGVDNAVAGGADAISTPVFDTWTWATASGSGPNPATITIPTAGVHAVSVFQREDGLSIDRLVIAPLGDPTPTGSGPPPTPRSGSVTAGPEVDSRSPAPGTTGVAVSASVIVGFSEPVAPGTITSASAALSHSGTSVAASRSLSADGTVLTIDPAANLASGTPYTVTLSGAITGIDGDALTGAPVTWGFTTASGTTLAAADIAGPAGLPDETSTIGETCIWDYDKDGNRDLLMSDHSSWILLRGLANDTFSVSPAWHPPADDRHSCATGDFGGVTASGAFTGPDGRPDVYISIGACQGTCTKPYPNELWLQTPSGTFVDAAQAFGVTDEHGRGRQAVTIDFDKDGLQDIFLGNEIGVLFDSPNRLFRNTSGEFTEGSGFGVREEIGNVCSEAADVNGDGWTDIVNCGANLLRVYRNLGGTSGFTNATSALGFPGFARDVELGDIDHDGDLDAVTVEQKILRLRLNQGGSFAGDDYTLALSEGRDVAIGDADGDGDQDVYVVQGVNATYHDILLMNTGSAGGGKWGFSSFPIPQAGYGDGDTAEAIPNWAGTGRAAFVVNNGKWGAVGPVQMIVLRPH